MLSAQELKIVLSTLNSRRAWLKKSLEEGKLEEAAKVEQLETFKLIDSAIKKLHQPPPSPEIRAQIKPQGNSVAPTIIQNGRERNFESARVLIADDDKSAAELLVGVLADMGLKNVDLSKDGREAFDRLKLAVSPYDIVLCDWDMPQLSGLEVHHKAKASNKLQGAYFCMVTGVSDSKRIRSAIQQGVNDYIVKPIDAGILEGKIRTAMKGRYE